MVNEKLTSFYTRNIRYYYNVDILAKKLLMYNLPYSTNMFMRNYSDNKVRYSYEELEMKKRVKYSLDRLYSVRNEKQQKLTQIKNTAKPHDLNNIKSKNDEPILECESSSIFNNIPKISGMSIFGKKSNIDEEKLFRIFQQEVYENILKDTERARIAAEKEAEKEAEKQVHVSNTDPDNLNVISSNEHIEAARQEAEKQVHVSNPDTDNLNVISSNEYIEAARKEAEKEAARQAAAIHLNQSVNNQTDSDDDSEDSYSNTVFHSESESESESESVTEEINSEDDDDDDEFVPGAILGRTNE